MIGWPDGFINWVIFSTGLLVLLYWVFLAYRVFRVLEASW